MKSTMKIAFSVFLLLGFVTSALADFSIFLDAGRLRLDATTPLSADNSVTSTNGSLLLLIAAGNDGTFSNVLNSGQYVAGNDVIIAAGGFNNSGGTDEVNKTFSSITYSSTGDQIALRWFPQITYGQYNNSTVPAAGQNFGTYSPPINTTPDGGDFWRVPSSGQINLFFFTNDSDGMGSQSPSQGYASFSVVPEPSAFVLIGVLGVLGAAKFYRKKYL
jgi:hypothetical protein